MKPLNCLTLFLESGKRFRLPSGRTCEQLRQPQPDSTPSMATTSTQAAIPIAASNTAIRRSVGGRSTDRKNAVQAAAGLLALPPEDRKEAIKRAKEMQANNAKSHHKTS